MGKTSTLTKRFVHNKKKQASPLRVCEKIEENVLESGPFEDIEKFSESPEKS